MAEEGTIHDGPNDAGETTLKTLSTIRRQDPRRSWHSMWWSVEGGTFPNELPEMGFGIGCQPVSSMIFSTSARSAE